MRWLLLKDLQILRRSPLLLLVLVLYAVVIGVPVGYGVSAPPSKPRVAFVNEVAPTDQSILVGTDRIDVSRYSGRLLDAIDRVDVPDRAAAIEAVRKGDAVAAVIVPSDITQRLQDAIGLAASGQKPTLDVYYSADSPLKREYVQQVIASRLADANRALSKQITRVAATYITVLLRGGDFNILGRQIQALGLQRSVGAIQNAKQGLSPSDPRRAQLDQVQNFAQLAVDNLDLSDEILTSIGDPLAVRQQIVGDGGGGSLDGFAIAAAICVALMFSGVLLAAGMLALEREEHAFGRLTRGLVRPSGLLGEKVVLGGLVAGVVALLLLGLLSLFQPVDWGRVGSWLPGLALGALAFAGLGVLVGAVTRDVRAASLLAFLLSLPVAALALIPEGTVSHGAYDAVRVVSALFPFRPALDALSAGLDAAGSIGPPLLHLAILIAAYGVLARVALTRFGRR